MTVQQLGTGASSDRATHWHGIDWVRCHSEVRRLQARIVKAERFGKHGRVKALQWLLTHSFSGKALAVKRVTENRGKRTPGVDGITWSTPKSKLEAVSSLKRRGYRPRPLRRIYIPKADRTRSSRSEGAASSTAPRQALISSLSSPIRKTTANPHYVGSELPGQLRMRSNSASGRWHGRIVRSGSLRLISAAVSTKFRTTGLSPTSLRTRRYCKDG